MTLLDALRTRLNITGVKRVCDRGTCGACTMIVDGRTVYACSMLAIEAQGKTIRTVESFTEGTVLHPVQQAFCDEDGLMCGFCTPGFVTADGRAAREEPEADAPSRRARRSTATSAAAAPTCACSKQRLEPKSAAGGADVAKQQQPPPPPAGQTPAQPAAPQGPPAAGLLSPNAR